MHITEKSSKIIKTAVLFTGIITVLLLVCGIYSWFYLLEVNLERLNVATPDPSKNDSDLEQIGPKVNTMEVNSQKLANALTLFLSNISSNVEITADDREVFKENEVSIEEELPPNDSDLEDTTDNFKKFRFPAKSETEPNFSDMEFTTVASNFRDDTETSLEAESKAEHTELLRQLIQDKIENGEYKLYENKLSFSATNPDSAMNLFSKSVIQELRLIHKIYQKLLVLQFLPKNRKNDYFINTTREYLQNIVQQYSFQNSPVGDIFAETATLHDMIQDWELICDECETYPERELLPPEIIKELIDLENLLERTKQITISYLIQNRN